MTDLSFLFGKKTELVHTISMLGGEWVVWRGMQDGMVVYHYVLFIVLSVLCAWAYDHAKLLVAWGRHWFGRFYTTYSFEVYHLRGVLADFLKTYTKSDEILAHRLIACEGRLVLKPHFDAESCNFVKYIWPRDGQTRWPLRIELVNATPESGKKRLVISGVCLTRERLLRILATVSKQTKPTLYYKNTWYRIRNKNLYFSASSVLDPLIRHLDAFLHCPFDKHDDTTCQTGVLLYGPPGTGKTSLVHMVARRYGMNILKLDLDDLKRGIVPDDLHSSSILLLDDADLLLEESKYVYSFLDVLSLPKKTKQIVFLTTNYRQRVPILLRRRGRIDLQLSISLMHEPEARAMMEHVLRTKHAATDKDIARVITAALQSDLLPVAPCVLETLLHRPGGPDEILSTLEEGFAEEQAMYKEWKEQVMQLEQTAQE